LSGNFRLGSLASPTVPVFMACTSAQLSGMSPVAICRLEAAAEADPAVPGTGLVA